MSDWSLSQLLSGLHDEIQQKLAIARKSFAHPGTKGDCQRAGLARYCCKPTCRSATPGGPRRTSSTATETSAIRSTSSSSNRQYSPFIFKFQGQTIVPAESVYAAFEAKQAINATRVEYAQKKVATVRRLHRTSLPIPHAGGTYPAKQLIPILGGLLTFESDWTPAFGDPLIRALEVTDEMERLDMGCGRGARPFHV